MTTRLAALALLMVSAACGGGSSSPTPASLAFTAEPASGSAVAPLAPVVTVELRDAAGLLVADATASVTVALAPGAGAAVLAGTTTRAAVAGVATFPGLAVARAGSGYRLTASSAGLTGATSAAFSVTPGPPAALSLVRQPADGRTGVALVPALEVSVLDAAGNAVEDYAHEVAVSLAPGPSGGPLTGATTVAAVGGVASFPDLAVGGAGPHALRVSLGGLPALTTTTFTLSDAWFSLGPDGGLVAVAPEPGRPLSALAGGEANAGLWRTEDGGLSWAPIAALRGRTLTPAFPQAGLAWAYGDSLWRSADGGVSWVETPGLALSQYGAVVGVARDPVSGVTYAAISDIDSRILASADDGATFTTVAPALPAGASLLEVAAGPGGLSVLTSQGFQTLALGALAWTAPVPVDTNPYLLLAHPTEPKILFAAGIFGLHRTGDGGVTWDQVAQGPFRDVWIDPADDAAVLALRLVGGLQVSGDGGLTFPTSVALASFEGLSLAGTASSLYLGADDGPYRSTDRGATWTAARGGLHARRVGAVAVSGGSPSVLLAAADHGALFRSLDGGGTFEPVSSGGGSEGRQLVFDPARPERAYFLNGTLMASDDAGATWTQLGAAPPAIVHLAICRQTPTTLWASDQNTTGVWRSTDAGATWARVFTRPDANFGVGDVSADAADPAVATFPVIDYAAGSARTGLWQTRDAGLTWNKLAEPFYGYLLVDGLEPGAFWALNGFSLKGTTDQGASFTSVSPPLTGAALALALDPADGSRLALGTVKSNASLPGDGVFLSADRGATWFQARSGHDLFSTYGLAFDPGDAATLYAATMGGGLLKTTTGGR